MRRTVLVRVAQNVAAVFGGHKGHSSELPRRSSCRRFDAAGVSAKKSLPALSSCTDGSQLPPPHTPVTSITPISTGNLLAVSRGKRLQAFTSHCADAPKEAT
jgi:hypothetical protein